MRNRAFGVEIECGYDGDGNRIEPPDCICEWDEDGDLIVGDHCQRCCGCWEGSDEGSDEGVDFATELLYANGFSHWAEQNIHSDGSGVEIPSPILCGREGLNELRRVMALLRDNGFYTSEEDGLHVHHDAPEFVEDDSLVARLVELWEENLPVIDRFVADYRQGGNYWACNSYQREDSYAHSWARFKETKSLGDIRLDKFRSLNVTALDEHGTVEFRLHEGTLNFDEAAAWIHFGQEFLESAKRTRNVVTCANVIDLLRFTRTSPSTTRKLVTKASGRREHAYA